MAAEALEHGPQDIDPPAILLPRLGWGTLVAAELVGAESGLGAMIFLARANLRTDVVVVGIIVIAVIGVLMEVAMRFLESKLIPWRGKG